MLFSRSVFAISANSEILELALNEAEQEANQVDMAYLIYMLGVHLLEEEEDYNRAMARFIRSRKIWETMGDRKGIERASSRISTIHFYHNEFDKAIQYGEEALAISRENKAKYNESLHLSNLGSIYGRLPEQRQQGVDYLLLGLEISLGLQDTDMVQTSYNNLGVVFERMNNLSEAEKNYFEAHRYALLLGDNQEACRVTTNLADVAFRQGLFQKALSYLDENVAQCEGADLRLTSWVAQLRSETYNAMGNHKEAYHYLTVHQDLNDSLFNTEKTKALAEMAGRYESEQDRQQIALLETKDQLNESRISRQRTFLFLVGAVLVLLAVLTYVIIRDKKRSEWLLSNILPAAAIRELKKLGRVKARKYESVSILFTDFVGFTSFAAKLSPEELVGHIDECYRGFDLIIKKHGCEKIKTIGDAYMAVCGITDHENDHAHALLAATREIMRFMEDYNRSNWPDGVSSLGIRAGIHSGTVVAGVVGLHKFAYDLWGDAVNVAARMEQNSQPWKINLSGATAMLLNRSTDLEFRGPLDVKGKEPMEMFFVS